MRPNIKELKTCMEKGAHVPVSLVLRKTAFVSVAVPFTADKTTRYGTPVVQACARCGLVFFEMAT